MKDSRQIELVHGDVDFNSTFGSFDLSVKIPEQINLGHVHIIFQTSNTSKGHEHKHKFEVQEVKKSFDLI